MSFEFLVQQKRGLGSLALSMSLGYLHRSAKEGPRFLAKVPYRLKGRKQFRAPYLDTYEYKGWRPLNQGNLAQFPSLGIILYRARALDSWPLQIGSAVFGKSMGPIEISADFREPKIPCPVGPRYLA